MVLASFMDVFWKVSRGCSEQLQSLCSNYSEGSCCWLGSFLKLSLHYNYISRLSVTFSYLQSWVWQRRRIPTGLICNKKRANELSAAKVLLFLFVYLINPVVNPECLFFFYFKINGCIEKGKNINQSIWVGRQSGLTRRGHSSESFA